MAEQVLNGVRNFYGAQDAEKKYPAVLNTDGYTKEMVVDFDFENLPTFSADGAMVMEIPADSLIVSARLHVTTAGVSGTSLAVGLYQADSTVIDLDGLITAAAGAAANLTKDAWLIGGGALVGATIGAAAGQIVVTETGTFTTGEYRLVVEYILPRS